MHMLTSVKKSVTCYMFTLGTFCISQGDLKRPKGKLKLLLVYVRCPICCFTSQRLTHAIQYFLTTKSASRVKKSAKINYVSAARGTLNLRFRRTKSSTFCALHSRSSTLRTSPKWGGGGVGTACSAIIPRFPVYRVGMILASECSVFSW